MYQQENYEVFKKMKIAEQELIKAIFPNYQIDLVENYERFDLIEHKKKYVMEVKVREFSEEDFSTKYKSNPIIEEEKYWTNYLKAEELGYQFIYVFGFKNKEGKIDCFYAYNLHHLNPLYFWQNTLLCPKNSINPNSKKIYKDCFVIRNSLFDSTNLIKRKLRNPITV